MKKRILSVMMAILLAGCFTAEVHQNLAAAFDFEKELHHVKAACICTLVFLLSACLICFIIRMFSYYTFPVILVIIISSFFLAIMISCSFRIPSVGTASMAFGDAGWVDFRGQVSRCRALIFWLVAYDLEAIFLNRFGKKWLEAAD